MTDTGIREKVARAMITARCLKIYGVNPSDERMEIIRGPTEHGLNYCIDEMTDSALLAIGYQEMREALEKCAKYIERDRAGLPRDPGYVLGEIAVALLPSPPQGEGT